MKTLPYILVTLMIAPLAQAASVKEICGVKRAPMTRINDLESAKKAVLEIRSLYPDSTVEQKANEVLSAIKELGLEPPSEDWEPVSPLERDEYKIPLIALAKIIRLKHIPPVFKPVKVDEKSKALTRLFTEYGKMEQRFANPKGYYQRMIEVIATTSRGKQLIACFQAKDGPRIISSLVEFTPREESALVDTGARAHYELRRHSSGNYHKILSFDPGPYPTMALNMVAHELQHSCNTPEFIKLQDVLHDLDQKLDSSPADVEARSTVAVKYAIDEMRAYKFEPEFFKELAVYHPAMFCNVFYVGSFYGRQVMSSADSMHSNESHMNNKNSFFHNLFEAYSARSYQADDYYVVDPDTLEIKRDAKGKRIMKEKVRQMFSLAGFPIE